jgi:outer membrane usher protein
MRRLTLDGSRLRPGFDLGQDIYPLLPTYKSGTLIVAGTGATVSATGRLVAATGQPVALEGAEITPLTDPKGKPVLLFTNRDGMFHVDGLAPGRHRLGFFGAPDLKLEFDIPSGTTGLYDLKVLTLPPGAKFEP